MVMVAQCPPLLAGVVLALIFGIRLLRVRMPMFVGERSIRILYVKPHDGNEGFIDGKLSFQRLVFLS